MSSSVRFLSWNINGSFVSRLPVLNGFRANYNVIFIQEHFLTKYSVNLLKLQESLSYYVPAQQRKNRGRPSGGPGTFVCVPLRSSPLAPSDHFLAVRVEGCVFINVYLPTDYCCDESERRFIISCEKLGSCLDKVKRLGLSCVVAGDFNCNLTERDTQESPRTILIRGIFGDRVKVVHKDSNFTYIHTASHTSNLNHI